MLHFYQTPGPEITRYRLELFGGIFHWFIRALSLFKLKRLSIGGLREPAECLAGVPTDSREGEGEGGGSGCQTRTSRSNPAGAVFSRSILSRLASSSVGVLITGGDRLMNRGEGAGVFDSSSSSSSSSSSGVLTTVGVRLKNRGEGDDVFDFCTSSSLSKSSE